MEQKYDVKGNQLQIQLSNQMSQMKSDYENQIYEIERRARREKEELEKENRLLHKVIFVLQKTVDKVFDWVADTISNRDREELKEDFRKDTRRHLDPYDQIEKEDRGKEWDMKR